jgi:hypothetical protein
MLYSFILNRYQSTQIESGLSLPRDGMLGCIRIDLMTEPLGLFLPQLLCMHVRVPPKSEPDLL